ncbi:MAG: sulfite exporter TauE/SafE family protein [Cyanobacteria bacterium J083]|nr:MAG: sulfite exporter TauE/SafE family protein [Cyanobacteria bacterium J083]
MSIWIIGHILAVCIGLSLGLLGGGGSILAVPILVYVLGKEAKVAIAMSLAIVGLVSLIGVIPHWRQGNVNFKTAISFAPSAMIGAFFGARLAASPLVTDTFQLVCFALIMLIASYFMIRKPKVISQSKPQKYAWLAITLEGLGVGVITGFVGVGGGFAIVPALVLLGGIPIKQAIGTSLLIIVFNSITGFLGYLNQVNIDWDLLFSFTLAAICGVVAGAFLSQKIQAAKLQKAFGYFLIATAIFILLKR